MPNLEKFKGSKFIFVVGIGGSDLAAKAVWNALTLHKNSSKKIFFLESPDSREYEEVRNFVSNEIASPGDVALIAVSKSGKTAETLEAFHKTFDLLSEKFGMPVQERVLVISSPDSPLWNLAGEKGIERTEWQNDIGGRFSVFTVAHTTPLFIGGIDSESFVSGGKEIESGRADSLAKKIFESYKNGAEILDFFFFSSELEDLGKWCRQLIAESLGKENARGEKVGITPTVSIGPTDLHSMLQLALGGPKNRFTIFVKSSKDIGESVNESAFEDAIRAYGEAGLPFEKYEMPEISERELGKFMAFMMTVTLELAKLLEVNPYDQPEVEKYKSEIQSA